MEIPNTFRLKGKLWVVHYIFNLHEDGEKVDGVCDTSTRQILIEGEHTKKKQFSTFLHELCHAMVKESHIPEDTEFTNAIEEILCDSFEDLFTNDFEVTLKEKFNA